MRTPIPDGRRGLTLFEALIALGVFAFAFGGMAIAIDAAVSAGIEARDVSGVRRVLENRLAYCLADPPPTDFPRVIEPGDGNPFRIEESLEAFEAVNAEQEDLAGLWTLRIKVRGEGTSAEVETLIYRP